MKFKHLTKDEKLKFISKLIILNILKPNKQTKNLLK